MSKRFTITALLITALIASASPTRAFSEMSLMPAPQLNCQPMGGDTLIGRDYRNFTFSRAKKDLEWTFRYRPEDDDYGITKWLLVPLHPTSEAKSGDKVLSLGTECANLALRESYSYNPKNVRDISVKRRDSGVLYKWNFEGRIRRVRDEVDSLALIGFNNSNQRVAFHFAAAHTGPRVGGTLWGKIEGLKCKVSTIGLPISQGAYVVSSRVLAALDLAGVPYADRANLILQSFSIYAAVDSDGRVKGKFGIKFDGSASDKQKALELAELALDHLLSELGSDVIDDIAISNPRLAKDIDDFIWTVDAKIYLKDWMSAVDALEETVSETDLDLCKIWD
jgi:hypothetical protein